jgi:phospholipase/carboxylesterase
MLSEEIVGYPEIKPLSGKADKLLVLLHGVGSDGHDLIGLVPFIQEALPHHHFISPHGVEPYDRIAASASWNGTFRVGTNFKAVC